MDALAPQASIDGTSVLSPQERQRAALSSLPSSPGERHLALAVLIISLLVFAAAAPFARIQLARLDAFIPIYQSILAINDLITTVLLFGQFAFIRSRSTLVLACGYLFAGLMAAVHMATFPGLFAPTGLLGAGPQTTAWLYMFWHAGFPLAVIGYVYLKQDEVADRSSMSTGAAIGASICAVAVAVAGMALLATSGREALPAIMQGNNYTSAMIVVVFAVWAFSLAALIVLWMRPRRSVLDTWLIVVMCAWMFDVALSAVLNAGRFDLGFYAGRVYGLLAASFVLVVLLIDHSKLYAKAWGVVGERTADLGKANVRFQALIDSSPLAIIGMSIDSRVTTWNRAAERIFGYSADETVGKPYALVPEEHRGDSGGAGGRIIRNGETILDLPVRRRHKDGRLLDIMISGAPLRDERGQINGAVCILEDVTEKRKVEKKLAQAQKMEAVGQLTSGIAHDFNNVLAVVIGNLDQQIEYLEDPKKVTKQAKIVTLGQAAIDAALRGADLVKRLLAFSRNQPLQPKLIDLGTTARNFEALLHRSIGDQITLELRIDGSLWPVMADPSQFENAVLNLVINARDAMPNGGRIRIACMNTALDEVAAATEEMQAGDYVTVTVSDSGTGIPPELLNRVFEPFFTTKEVGKGSGLGLSMVFGYARQSGGTVKIYSEVGHGTDVRIYLPRATATGTMEAVKTVAAPVPTGQGRILVVEDKPDVRKMALELLGGLGYRTVETADAAAALAVLDRGETFDLLFTDVVMPGGISGLGLAREVRKRFPTLPIVFSTGFADPEAVRTETATLGASIVHKPFRKAELAQALRQALDGVRVA